MSKYHEPTTYIVDGHEVRFWYPSIKTDIPVGENDRTAEDMENTRARVEFYESARGFISHNLHYEDFTRYLRMLNEGYRMLGFAHYAHNDSWQLTTEGNAYDWADKFEPLTEDGKRELRAACVTEGRKFTKRLRAYLKRYGTSKLHVWTYWTEA